MQHLHIAARPACGSDLPLSCRGWKTQNGWPDPREEIKAVRWGRCRRLSPERYQTYQEKTEREGMDGISPRFIINRISPPSSA